MKTISGSTMNIFIIMPRVFFEILFFFSDALGNFCVCSLRFLLPFVLVDIVVINSEVMHILSISTLLGLGAVQSWVL